MAYPGRTTALEMAKICALDASLDTTLAIDTANEIVTEVCAAATKVVAGVEVAWHSSARLTLIETWLACHCYCINDPRGQRERVGPLTFEAQSKVDLGLDVTHYGQMAKRIDTSGALAALDDAIENGRTPGRFTCSIHALGKLYSDWDSWPATVGGN